MIENYKTSRSGRFIAATISGYANIAANILFTLLSIPLALIFLGKEEFGLWALAAQINGYLILVEFGMSQAIGRLIADHKDDVNGGNYGNHLATAGLVLVTQGIIIGVTGYSLSWIAPNLLNIPSNYIQDFRHLLIILSIITGINIACRCIGAPLWAFQRLDVINAGFTFGTILSLASLWFGFECELGIYAYPASQIPALILIPIFHLSVCCRNNYFPSRGCWGAPKLTIFQQIFQHGKNAFLLQVGNQLLNASQIIIVSRTIGLNAAATYSVCTKLFMMGRMLMISPVSASVPGLTELFVRKEKKILTKRFSQMRQITISVAVVVGVAISSGNRSFISIWTDGKIEWTWAADGLLGLILILKTLNISQSTTFEITKNWHQIRLIYLMEGFVFVIVGILLSKKYGITGVLCASILATCLTSLPFLIKKGNRLIRTTPKFYNRLALAALTIPIATTANFIFKSLHMSNIASIITSSLLTALTVILAWNLLVEKTLRKEILTRISTAIKLH